MARTRRAHQPPPARRPRSVTSPGLAEAALRAGLTLMAIVAATNAVAALAIGAGATAAAQGVVLVSLALAGVVRTDLAARLLLPKGRVVAVAGLFALAGALDAGLYDHFGGIAGAIVCLAALVGSARRVGLCLAVSVAGYLGALALHGSSPAWMLGDGSYVLAGQLVNLAGNGAVGLLLVALLRRFLASAPRRLADVRAGGPSLTPQLALAAGGGPVKLLAAADARTLTAALTGGERDVMRLLADGRVPKQAAQDLSIALATVRSRIASAKRKTGARTLDQLVGLYAEAALAAPHAEAALSVAHAEAALAAPHTQAAYAEATLATPHPDAVARAEAALAAPHAQAAHAEAALAAPHTQAAHAEAALAAPHTEAALSVARAEAALAAPHAEAEPRGTELEGRRAA